MSIVRAQAPNRNYEGVVILHPDVTEAQQKEFFKKNIETLKSYKGELNHLDTWGKRRLANPIDKMKMGTYFHITFSAQPECVGELERTMRIDDRVLRFTHVRLDDRQTLAEHVEAFKNGLAESMKREQEREAKRDLRRRDSGFSRGPNRNESRPGGRFSSFNRNDDGDMGGDSESED